jgi:predicted nucleic acid-binding Zn ribbon protein
MATKTKTCEVCEREFTPGSNAARTCSADCREVRRKKRRYVVERVRNADGSWSIVKEEGERHPDAAEILSLAAQRLEITNVIAELRTFIAKHPDHETAPDTLRKAIGIADLIDRQAQRLVEANRDVPDFIADAKRSYPWMTLTEGRHS